MARVANCSALQVAWTFPPADTVSVGALKARLAAGQESRLFDLESWNCRAGKARAVLTLAAPLEDIVAVIWGANDQPVALRHVERRRTVARQA